MAASAKRYSMYWKTRWRVSRFRVGMLSGLQVTTPMWSSARETLCSHVSKGSSQMYPTFCLHLSPWKPVCGGGYEDGICIVDDFFVDIYFHFVIKVWREERLFEEAWSIYRCWANASIKALPNSLVLSSGYCGACAHLLHNFGGILHQP